MSEDKKEKKDIKDKREYQEPAIAAEHVFKEFSFLICQWTFVPECEIYQATQDAS